MKINKLITGLLTGLFMTGGVSAEIPSDDMLNQLRNKIISENKCETKCYTLMDSFVMVQNEFAEIRLEYNVEKDNQAVPLYDIESRNGIIENYLISKIDSVTMSESPLLTQRVENKNIAILNKGRNIILIKKTLPERNAFKIKLSETPLRSETISSNDWNVLNKNTNGLFSFEKVVEKTEEVNENPSVSFKENKIVPLIKVEREFYFTNEWRIKTKIYSLNKRPMTFNYPLLKGENVFSKGEIKEQKYKVSLNGYNNVSWESILDKNSILELKSNLPYNVKEEWKLYISNEYNINFHGINMIQKYVRNNYNPIFLPEQNAELTLNIAQTESVKGNEETLLSGAMNIGYGKSVNNIDLSLKIKSSLSKEHKINIPDNLEIIELYKDGQKRKIIQEGQDLIVNLTSGVQNFNIKFKETHFGDLIYKSPKINLNMDGANNYITVKLERNNWLLFVGGSHLSPIILFWGILISVVLVSIIVSKVIKKPLSLADWILIGVGTTCANIFAFVILIGALAYYYFKQQKQWIFRGQNALGVIIGVTALGIMITTVAAGLLFAPNMMITGFNSSGYTLNWYQDFSTTNFFDVWFITINIMYYKIFILIWSLWLAISVIKWIKWIWNNSVEDNAVWNERRRLLIEENKRKRAEQEAAEKNRRQQKEIDNNLEKD